MTYLEQRREHINAGRPLKPKKIYRLKPVSDKTAAKIAAEKEQRGDGETEKQIWFGRRRIEMTGTCQCGCGMPSSKYDDKKFRSSICHIFPQRLFSSVALHHLNWVERKYWATQDTSACHAQMDNKSMDLWPNFADWDDIKEKFFVLAPLLTDKERKHKFYKHLEYLVYKKD